MANSYLFKRGKSHDNSFKNDQHNLIPTNDDICNFVCMVTVSLCTWHAKVFLKLQIMACYPKFNIKGSNILLLDWSKVMMDILSNETIFVKNDTYRYHRAQKMIHIHAFAHYT